ncbi:MAG TPA: hypothetical protein DEB31_11640 [Clostridiales bacterium]|nr:hypothetical protein [Clostridiales bacterium]
MQLNPDCVRDVLLNIDFVSGFKDGMLCDTDSYEIAAALPDYSRDAILYALKALSDGDMIDAKEMDMIADHDFIVKDITPKGRDFLSAIRPKSTWDKIKEKLSALMPVGMDVLVQVVSVFISSKLG